MVEICLDYAKTREAFGKPIGKFQNTRFLIAEMATEARITRVFLDDCIAKHIKGELDATGDSLAKSWAPEPTTKLVRSAEGRGGKEWFSQSRTWLWPET